MGKRKGSKGTGRRAKAKPLPNIGKEELAVFQFIRQNTPATVRQVAEHFAGFGKARTTILTVMERLREKGFLQREKKAGAFQYSPTPESCSLTASLIKSFVNEVLGGSVMPFMAYMSESNDISPDELQELKRIVESMEAKHGHDSEGDR